MGRATMQFAYGYRLTAWFRDIGGEDSEPAVGRMGLRFDHNIQTRAYEPGPEKRAS